MTTLRQSKNRLSWKGWALLLLVGVIAALLRLWDLGEIPSGLYRDEAINGLDALDVLTGQRDGQSPFYFSANNGREPLYIYLTAMFIKMFGRNAFAVRLAAAIIGTLTTWFIYKLATSWFDRLVGLLSAWIWAVTLWPIHLSRIGFRSILLPFMLTLTLWLGTLAYIRQKRGEKAVWIWLFAGVVYGISFYTYIAVRFTPIFFVLFFVYLGLTKKLKPLWPGLAWSFLGLFLTLTPLLILAWQQSDLVIGRMSQVSILNPAINQGDLIGLLWRNGWRALGLFFLSGDKIIRHNPPGRPVFDLLMAIPFIIGLVWCLYNWRRSVAMALLLWIFVMLGPTVLAEDTPHFLRSVGLLPGLVIIPAIGLSRIWTWPRLQPKLGPVLVSVLLAASLVITIKDYFFDYGTQQSTTYWFETAARDLAEKINDQSDKANIMLDEHLWSSWPSLRFLVEPKKTITLYQSENIEPDQINGQTEIYAWPYENLAVVAGGISPPAVVSGQMGSLAQGDLDPQPYPLFVHYSVIDSPNWPILANFDNTIQLRRAEADLGIEENLEVDLYWSSDTGLDRPIVTFVHLVNPDGTVAQSDALIGGESWSFEYWKPGLIIHEQHEIDLNEVPDWDQNQILIGLYDASSAARLPLLNADGVPIGDTWPLLPQVVGGQRRQ